MATTQLTADETTKLKAAFANMDTAAEPKAAVAALASPREDFCKFWPQVKGVLQFLANLPGVPQSIKGAVNTIINIGDKASSILC